jgi:uncharacterized membrane protein YozB (DUF420 family)
MIPIEDLPHVNAVLNAVSSVLIVAGYIAIRQGRRERHRAFMLSAAVVSALFLVTYLTYHFNSGLARFGGTGAIRTFYFAFLIAHVAIAAIITPLVPITLSRALSGRFDKHRRIARWTLPLWLYVSVSGVVVYIMAVHLYPWSPS